jgi:hypothetical protein
MKTHFAVSQTQQKGWQHPLVARVLEALAVASDQELSQVLEEVVVREGLMTPFLSLPFTEESVEATRLLRTWNNVLKKYEAEVMRLNSKLKPTWWKGLLGKSGFRKNQTRLPKAMVSPLVADFHWKFWKPEQDEMSALFVAESAGGEVSFLSV